MYIFQKFEKHWVKRQNERKYVLNMEHEKKFYKSDIKVIEIRIDISRLENLNDILR